MVPIKHSPLNLYCFLKKAFSLVNQGQVGVIIIVAVTIREVVLKSVSKSVTNSVFKVSHKF